MKKSYIFLAEGFEEIEALTPVDVLRRAGMDVKTVAVGGSREVTGAHGVTVLADMLISDCDLDDAEFLILPGGMPGATNLHNSERLRKALKAQAERGGKIAAICASPAVVLAPLGLLNGKEATCYPGFEKDCIASGAIYRDMPVVALNEVITGSGPAAALKFSLAIVANAMGEGIAQEVGSQMLHYPKQIDMYL